MKGIKSVSSARARFNMGFRGHWLQIKCQYAGFESVGSYPTSTPSIEHGYSPALSQAYD